jgi:hypothetical protein
MGILGRYLDLLPADARERVLTARRWTAVWRVDELGARNVLGHAEDWRWPDPHGFPECGAPEVFRLRAVAGDELWTDESLIGRRFRRLAERCGLERGVALIQARLRRHEPFGVRLTLVI